MNEVKGFFASKTIWFALLFAAFSVANLFGYADYTPTTDVAEIVNLVVSAVVLVLRLLTNKGIKLQISNLPLIYIVVE